MHRPPLARVLKTPNSSALWDKCSDRVVSEERDLNLKAFKSFNNCRRMRLGTSICRGRRWTRHPEQHLHTFPLITGGNVAVCWPWRLKRHFSPAWILNSCIFVSLISTRSVLHHLINKSSHPNLLTTALTTKTWMGRWHWRRMRVAVLLSRRCVCMAFPRPSEGPPNTCCRRH